MVYQSWLCATFPRESILEKSLTRDTPFQGDAIRTILRGSISILRGILFALRQLRRTISCYRLLFSLSCCRYRERRTSTLLLLERQVAAVTFSSSQNHRQALNFTPRTVSRLITKMKSSNNNHSNAFNTRNHVITVGDECFTVGKWCFI